MNSEREQRILEILLQEKQVTVKDLSKRLFTSEPSIRRDLVTLENQHLLRRVYGGAILEENDVTKRRIPFQIREMDQQQEKIRIAKKAAALVGDNAFLFLDSSSSAYNMIPFLTGKKNLTVITNGLKTQIKLSENNIRTISTGGMILNGSYALCGDESYKTIERYNADFFFFSCRGLSDDGELTDISEPEDYVRLKMIAHSASSYLLCNSNKISTKYAHHLCHASELSGIISECTPPVQLKPYFLP